jgi:hypothetical protein
LTKGSATRATLLAAAAVPASTVFSMLEDVIKSTKPAKIVACFIARVPFGFRVHPLTRVIGSDRHPPSGNPQAKAMTARKTVDRDRLGLCSISLRQRGSAMPGIQDNRWEGRWLVRDSLN